MHMNPERARERLKEERRNLRQLKEDRAETADLDESQQESTGSLSDYDQHPGDKGTETFERSKELSIENQFDGRLQDIDAALERLDEGAYGRCERCGKQISDERLEAEPATRYCAEHQREADEEREADHGMEMGQELREDI